MTIEEMFKQLHHLAEQTSEAKPAKPAPQS